MLCGPPLMPDLAFQCAVTQGVIRRQREKKASMKLTQIERLAGTQPIVVGSVGRIITKRTETLIEARVETGSMAR